MMLKTNKTCEISSDIDWINLKNSIVCKLEQKFRRFPNYYFTEHDLHSALYNITKEEMKLLEVLSETTSDGFQVSLVHHEYPTPFRCGMDGTKFVRVDEPPYRRGYYDLVIFNPNFVANNTLEVVCGKDYQKFKPAMNKVTVEPLIWACEVVYFPRTKPIPRNAYEIIEQDVLKLEETLEHKVGSEISFCRFASTLVFTSHEGKIATRLKQLLNHLDEQRLEICLISGGEQS